VKLSIHSLRPASSACSRQSIWTTHIVGHLNVQRCRVWCFCHKCTTQSYCHS
jgi:hypothetical protein